MFTVTQSTTLAQWDLERVAQQQIERQGRRARHFTVRIATNAVQVRAKAIENEFLDGHADGLGRGFW